jgi:hypothetical protein
MSDTVKRSRLSVDIPAEEHLLLKVLAASQRRSINDFVLSCIREHLPCNKKHNPNTETAAALRDSAQDKNVIAFDSSLEMFEYLGLPTTCLTKKSPKNSKKMLKKPAAKKKI